MSREIRALVAAVRTLATNAPQGTWEATESERSINPAVTINGQPMFSTGNATKRSRSERESACLYVAGMDPSVAILLCDTITTLLDDQERTTAKVLKLVASMRERR